MQNYKWMNSIKTSRCQVISSLLEKIQMRSRSTHDVMGKEREYSIMISEFELQSFSFELIHLEMVWTLYPLCFKLKRITVPLLQGWLWPWITSELWYIGNHSREWPESFLLNSYYTEVWGGCYSIPWIAPIHHWSVPYNAEC